MRVLLDASLPSPRTANWRHGNTLERWDAEDLTDTDLVVVAAQRGYGAVVFLGPQALARRELEETSRRAGIAVVVTASEVPTDASRHVQNHFDSIVSKASPGAILLLRSDGVKTLSWSELSSTPGPS
jgi:hypothetical protein